MSQKKTLQGPRSFGAALGPCQGGSDVFLRLSTAPSWLQPTEGSPVPAHPWRAHLVAECVSHRPSLAELSRSRCARCPHLSALKADVLSITHLRPLPSIRSGLHCTPAAESKQTTRLTAWEAAGGGETVSGKGETRAQSRS